MILVFAGHTYELTCLIRVFTVPFMGSQGPNASSCGQQRLIRLVWLNTVDTDQTAPEGAVWSGSALFAIKVDHNFGLIRNPLAKNKYNHKTLHFRNFLHEIFNAMSIKITVYKMKTFHWVFISDIKPVNHIDWGLYIFQNFHKCKFYKNKKKLAFH